MRKSNSPVVSLFLVLFTALAVFLSGCGSTGAISPAEKQDLIDAAIRYQTEGGTYNADSYQVEKLKKGQLVFGMLPGQSVFYTDQTTVTAGGGSYKTLYALLQIRPHPVYGYRTKLGKYRVVEDMYAASGKCLANKTIKVEGKNETLGDGGGFQYVIFNYTGKLVLIESNELHE